MSSLSERKIIEILTQAYNVEAEEIKPEVIEYFKNVSTSRIILALARTPKGIPYKQILENGKNISEAAEEYGISSDILRRRIKEYEVVTKGFEIKRNPRKRKVDEENEL